MELREKRRIAAFVAALAILAAGAAGAVSLHRFQPGFAAVLCFSAVIAASLLISWGAEAAQFMVSQGLAVALIALLQVVPELMVEAVIAWEAGRTGRVALVFANATGSNRLLTGFGWPLIFFIADFFHRRKHGRPLEALRLRPEHVLEVLALLLGGLWYLVIIFTGRLTLVDSVVLGGAFVAYLWALNRLPAENAEEVDELMAPPRLLANLTRWRRPVTVVALFLLGGAVMYAVAEPFLSAMTEVAVAIGVSQFAFVQWVAPFLTEFPEKVTAIYWSRTVKLAPMALLNMVSSTVNQFTALVAMIPIAYSVSAGHVASIPMDALHRTEVFLSFATVLYGAVCLFKLRFTRGNALVMGTLFLIQFVYEGQIDLPTFGEGGFRLTGIEAHLVVAWTYVAFSVAELARHAKEIRIGQALGQSFAAMRRR